MTDCTNNRGAHDRTHSQVKLIYVWGCRQLKTDCADTLQKKTNNLSTLCSVCIKGHVAVTWWHDEWTWWHENELMRRRKRADVLKSIQYQLLIYQQRSHVSHTLSVCLHNIWAGKHFVVWHVLLMDGFWLQPLRMKNLIFKNTRLSCVYLLFSLKRLSPGCRPRLHMLLLGGGTQTGKMIELALPSTSSAYGCSPPQRVCHSNPSVIFGLVHSKTLRHSLNVL